MPAGILGQAADKFRTFFVGVTRGSSKQYTLIQPVIAAVTDPTTKLTTIEIQGDQNFAEALTFPAGFWQVVCPAYNYGLITGNMTWNAAAGSVIEFTNLYITGTLTGSTASGSPFLFLTNTGVTGAVSLTGGTMGVFCQGFANNLGTSASFIGFDSDVSLTGNIYADAYYFAGNITCGGARLSNCFLTSGKTMTCSTTDTRLIGCRVSGAFTFVFSGSAGFISTDQFTMTQLLTSGVTVTNGKFSSTLGVFKSRPAAYGNGGTGSTNIINAVNSPAGQYRASFYNKMTAGTAASNIMNVIYEDGGTTTLPVTPSLAAAGKANGVVTFFHDGTAPIKYSVAVVGGASAAGQADLVLEFLGNA